MIAKACRESSRRRDARKKVEREKLRDGVTKVRGRKGEATAKRE